MTLVFMFPGQSSLYPGMLDKLACLHPRADAVLAEAEAALGRDLRAHYSDKNPGAYDRNVDVQLGVFSANHMMLAALQGEGVDAEVSLGLSLGEYNHLVHIGALEFVDALQLVKTRGEAYDGGPRGWMASIQPIVKWYDPGIAFLNVHLDVCITRRLKTLLLEWSKSFHFFLSVVKCSRLDTTTKSNFSGQLDVKASASVPKWTENLLLNSFSFNSGAINSRSIRRDE